jgi:hypothetical protein
MRIRLVLGCLLIAVLAWFAWRLSRSPGPPGGEPRADSTSAGFIAARLYFASPSGDGLVTESREMMESENLHDRVAALVAELDRGPKGPGVATLPSGTSVLHVYLDDRGLMTVDLSRAFQQGFRGGSTAEYLAVASLVRTLGSNLPEVKNVLLACGGSALPTLGGHLPLDRPIEVADLP